MCKKQVIDTHFCLLLFKLLASFALLDNPERYLAWKGRVTNAHTTHLLLRHTREDESYF